MLPAGRTLPMPGLLYSTFKFYFMLKIEHCANVKVTITVFIISMPVRTSGFKIEIER